MNNILIIRFSSLGDIVLTEPIVRALKTTYPTSRISYLTKEGYLPLLEMFSGIDQTISLTSGSALGELRDQLKRLSFDLIVDLHRNLRSRSICLGLPGRKVAAGKEWLRRVARVRLKWLATSPKHVVERYSKALENLDIVTAPPAPRLRVSESNRAWIRCVLHERRLDGNYYVIAAGAVHSTKRAPAELWAKIAEEIRKRTDTVPVLVGSLDERGFLGEVAKQLALDEKSVFAEEDIRRSAAVIDGAAFALSNDSGLSHLAAALGRPTLTLFGPTHPTLGFAPAGHLASHFTVDEYCSPCSLHGKRKCYRQERYCFTKMDPVAIAEKLSSLLPKSSEMSGYDG